MLNKSPIIVFLKFIEIHLRNTLSDKYVYIRMRARVCVPKVIF